ncbi:hypothetical protein CBOM_01546 [Ceraceosorus bombacis]|uniref:Uncharacterized protein n=1 Tax=Ceraceosorus bombacis TaxID=401625 RepID=A0A0P1BCN4_9BASI|nr:hypothetical protein CBOM_01546 [Ceraceosorus bombacis]
MKFSPLKLLAIAVGAVSIAAPAFDGQNITIKAALEVQAAIQKATDTTSKCTGAILDGDVEVIIGHLAGIHAHVKSTISNFTQAGAVLNVELVVDHMMTIDLHLKVLLKSMHGISVTGEVGTQVVQAGAPAVADLDQLGRANAKRPPHVGLKAILKTNLSTYATVAPEDVAVKPGVGLPDKPSTPTTTDGKTKSTPGASYGDKAPNTNDKPSADNGAAPGAKPADQGSAAPAGQNNTPVDPNAPAIKTTTKTGSKMHADAHVQPDGTKLATVDGKNGAVAEARLKGFSDDLILACASKLSLQVDYDPPTNNGTAPQKQNKRSEQPLPESYWKCLSDTQAKAQGTHAKLQQGSKAKAAGTVTDGKTDCDDPKKKEDEPKETAKPADKVGKRAIPYGSRRVLSIRA